MESFTPIKIATYTRSIQLQICRLTIRVKVAYRVLVGGATNHRGIITVWLVTCGGVGHRSNILGLDCANYPKMSYPSRTRLLYYRR